jgi:hypothetical protein
LEKEAALDVLYLAGSVSKSNDYIHEELVMLTERQRLGTKSCKQLCAKNCRMEFNQMPLRWGS